METLGVYLPIDRWQALAQGRRLPDRAQGAALFADVSGFTRLTEALVNDLGAQRGAEELTRTLNLVYDALIAELHRFGGSVISFSGDAITCWFDADTGLRAVTCAVAMQAAMTAFGAIPTPSGKTVALAMKVAVAAGPVRRFVVGDPAQRLIDALAGALLDDLASAEHHAGKGEVVLTEATAAALDERVTVAAWRRAEDTGERFAVLGALRHRADPLAWTALMPDDLADDLARPWLLPEVYRRLKAGQGDFLAELRPAVALFLRFGGLDYDGDEAAGRKLDGYIRQVQRILAEYDGTLLGLTIGDKGSYLYAAFGAPVAHEDDAARAVAAALRLQVLPLSFSDVGVQIGISQGRVRTGAYGGTMRRTYGVLGHEVNVAARLMQAAQPGQTLVSAVTRHAAGHAFAWEDLGEILVKGRDVPVAVFGLQGRRERETIHLQSPRYALPMVGRAAELRLIGERLEEALRGHGQVVGLSAEAGMGKSRLVAEAITLANARGLVGYGGECQSYGTNSAYLVWQPIWRSFFALDAGWTLEQQVAALDVQLRLINPALLPRLPLLGAILSLPLPDNDLTRAFDAKLRKASLEALLVDCLRARAREAPVLLVLEDCHWLDPLSHDLLEAIARAIAELPVLILMAYRPPDLTRLQAPRVSGLPYFHGIQLTDFSPAEAEYLIRLKLEQFQGGATGAPPALIERIVGRAQGNPFYIEELLNYLNDRGLDPADHAALERLDLPVSLHSLILSRIDQLSESQKTTLKVASVIGRFFRAAMLWGVYPQLGEFAKVTADLDALGRLDLTSQDEPEPELAYLFKHVLTQEVVYESLPYATRAYLHEQIGQYLERTSGGNLDHLVNLLAHHYDHSDNVLKKREYVLRAGQLAQAAYANAAAIDYYQRALPLLPLAEQVNVLRRLGQVLELVGRWPEANATYQRALLLAGQIDDRAGQAHCRAALGELSRKQGQYGEALARLDEAQAAFEALGDQDGLAQVLQFKGSLASQQGDRARARDLYEAALAVRRGLDDRSRIASLLSNLGIVARAMGDYSQARQLHDESLALRRGLGDRWAIAVSLNNIGNVALDQADLAEARQCLEEAVTLQREVGDRAAIAISLNNLANVIRTQADLRRAGALYVESVRVNRELGDNWGLAYLLEDIGCLRAMEGRGEQALQLVGAASALRETIRAPLSPVEQAKLDKALAALPDFPAAQRQAAWEAGRALTVEQAVALAVAGLGE